jgi:uncharacterized DUF497 family protein
MRYEWDEHKRLANLKKHGIDFEDAIAIFEGPVLERIDDRKNYGEVRYIVIGKMIDIELVLVYTPRGDPRRLISARRANRNERKAYQAHLGATEEG